MGLFGKSPKERDGAARALHAGKKALSEGRYDQAIQDYADAIKASRKAARQCDDIYVLALDGSAAAEIMRRNFDAADRYVRDADYLVEKNNWQGAIQQIVIMSRKASVRFHQGDLQAAIELSMTAYQRLVPVAKQPGDYKYLARIAADLAGCYSAKGIFRDAERWSTIALEHCRGRGIEIPLMWSRALANRCMLPVPASGKNEFLAELKGLVTEFEGRFGPGHPDVAEAWAAVATRFAREGRSPEGLDFIRRCLDFQPTQPTPKHLAARATLLNIMGLDELNNNRADIAEQLFREAIKCSEMVKGPETEHSVVRINNLGVALREQSRLVEAETMLKDAVRRAEKQLGPNHFHTGNSLKNLAQVYLKMNRREDSAALLEQSIERLSVARPGPHPIDQKLKEARRLLSEQR